MNAISPADLQRAVEILRRGGVVAYPTDTLYGLAVDPRSDQAVQRLFAVKEREQGRAVPLIAASLEQASQAAVFTDVARRAAAALWPGPLTFVLDSTAALARGARADDGSVAIRVPASGIARQLAEALGFCVTATSANRSGEPPSASAVAVSHALGDRIDLVLDGGDTPGGLPSTIVDLRGAAPQLVRAGAIAWDRVLRSIQ